MKGKKTSKVTSNTISEKLYKSTFETYNAILKTEPVLWRQNENIPISFITSNNASFDFSNGVMKCLNKNTYKICLEGQIKTNYETTLSYNGSGCPDNEYKECFLTKKVEPGVSNINWSVILELDYGKEFVINTTNDIEYSGQLIILKI